jgi:hypothetical protein
MTKFIISSEQIEHIEKEFGTTLPVIFVKLFKSVRDNPILVGDERFTLSFDAIMMIHKELSNINNMTSHIDSLLTPMGISILENNTRIINEERDRILELFEVCLQEEGFLALDQDEPVVSIPDVKRLIEALRSKS